jgi:hypothetical protein
MAATSKTTERSDAPKAPERDAPKATPKGTIALDDSMVGGVIASGGGSITRIAMVAQGETNVSVDALGRPSSGYFRLRDGVGGPQLVGFYSNDAASGVFTRPFAQPIAFASGLVADAVPKGSRWSITTA